MDASPEAANERRERARKKDVWNQQQSRITWSRVPVTLLDNAEYLDRYIDRQIDRQIDSMYVNYFLVVKLSDLYARYNLSLRKSCKMNCWSCEIHELTMPLVNKDCFLDTVHAGILSVW